MPGISNLRLYGTRTYSLDENLASSNTINSVATVTCLIGYQPKGYIVYNSKTKKTLNVCNVQVDKLILYRHDYPSKEILNILFDRNLNFENKITDLSAGCSSDQTVFNEVSRNLDAGRSSYLPASQNPEENKQENEIEVEMDYDWDEDPKRLYFFWLKADELPVSYIEGHYDKYIYACDNIPVAYYDTITSRAKE